MELRETIAQRTQEAIKNRVFPGCVIGIVRRMGESVVMPFGHETYEVGASKVRADSVYDLASVTKSIPVASLALTFIHERKLALDDKVSKYLPALQNDYDATIEDLLRYRVQGVRMSTLQHNTFEEIRTHVLETGFVATPGESVYTNLPAYILGMILERVGDASFAELSHRYLFEPLGMHDTTFFPTASDCAPTEVEANGTNIQGIPHDESARVFARARRSVGHAGLFSTAGDILVFLRTLESLEYQYLLDGAERGLGWQTAGAFLGSHASPRAFGKTGFTGTSVCVDPERGISFVILSNRTYPHRPVDSSAINSFRAEIAGIILQ
jgi:CubicO group peptidase (beta-lactamase class C family)